MSRTRRSLRDRDQEAIAGTEPKGTVEQPAPAAPPLQTPPEASSEDQAPKATQTPGTSSTTRIGIYFHAQEFTAAKAAYLGDWTAGGEADTFAKWIASALNQHADRPAQQRVADERPPRTASGRGVTRSFDLPTHPTERMRAAIIEDQHVGRWVSMSDWCGDAVHAAVQAARKRAGGVLPDPPARLPNRLIR